MTEIAVVMPSFNRPNIVQQTIRSVQAQTFKDWKLYVMDNSSPNLWPRMEEIYVQYAKDDPRILIDHTDVKNEERLQKQWICIVTNKAVYKLDGSEPFICLTNDDIYLCPNKLEVLHDYLVQHEEAEAVAGRFELLNDEGACVQTFGGGSYANAYNQLDWVQPMYRRTLLEKIGFFPEEPFTVPTDVQIWVRITKLGVVIYGVSDVLDKTYTRTRNTYVPGNARAIAGMVME